MSKIKNRQKQGPFFRRIKRRPVKTITILPSLVTIVNGVCGFGAIVFAGGGSLAVDWPRSLVIASYLVFVAMIADMLDGRLARMSHSTSSFGGQLDSLCDAISFGVAPAFIMLKLLTHHLAEAGLTGEHLVTRFLWLCALAYTCCAVIRLARFNVENVESETDHGSFIGLPSPAAAGVVCSLVLLHQETWPQSRIIPLALPFVTLGAAVLMVSRIRYIHVPNHYLAGKKPLNYLIMFLLPLGALIVYPQVTLALFFCGFALSSVVRAAYLKLRHRRAEVAAVTEDLNKIPSSPV